LLKFHSICFSSVLFCFFIWFYFYSNGSNSQLCAHRFDCKKHDFTIFFYSHKLTFVSCFSSTRVSLGFFSTKLHMFCSSKIDKCSLNIMLNNNFNSLTPWDSQNPYNPRLSQKQALWASSKKKKTTTFNIIIS
jgi:hypothetical protein